jgi:hypothetical protein
MAYWHFSERFQRADPKPMANRQSAIANLPLLVQRVLMLASTMGALATGADAQGPPARARDTQTGIEVRTAPDEAALSGVLEAPADTVWTLLADAYRTLGIQAEVQDRGALTYGTRRHTQRNLGGKRAMEYVRCANQGAGPSAATGRRLRLIIVTTVRADGPGRSRLRTDVVGQATTIEGTSNPPVDCVTNGKLEMRLNQLMGELVRGWAMGR